MKRIPLEFFFYRYDSLVGFQVVSKIANLTKSTNIKYTHNDIMKIGTDSLVLCLVFSSPFVHQKQKTASLSHIPLLPLIMYSMYSMYSYCRN